VTKETKKQVGSQKRRPQAKLVELARDITEGKVFGSWMMPKSEGPQLGMVFMPLFFMDKEQLPPNTAEVFEYYDKAGPRSVNGMPVFMSMHILTKTEAPILKDLIDKITAAKTALDKELAGA